MRADTECCLVTFRISKTKIYAESCYRVLLCEALSIDEKEPHCELLQSAALWRSDAEREYEIPSWYENHCLMHIGECSITYKNSCVSDPLVFSWRPHPW